MQGVWGGGLEMASWRSWAGGLSDKQKEVEGRSLACVSGREEAGEPGCGGEEASGLQRAEGPMSEHPTMHQAWLHMAPPQ